MCGIAGIIKINKPGSPVTLSQLETMSRVIVHRGPDADGHWLSRDSSCGFAFRRLAIVDLSPAGNQPMSTPDGKYTIVFNGEIYNHTVIRKELIEKGVQYHSRSDTETILHGYGAYGSGILDKMLGMWGLAIWDEEKKELFAARDRIGIKPFYYYYENGTFVFGSEIKAILTHPEVSKELNYDELPNYLNFGTTSNTNSLFSKIHKLPAGHYLILKSDGTLLIKRYWSPYSNGDSVADMNEKEIGTETLRLLKQSIKDRMMSDVPFGVFLSGGVDSSLNVALMAELMDRPIDTYTVGFRDLEKYNELQYARQVSDLFKTNHREILVDKEDAFPVLDELAWHEDEPNGDPVCIPLYFLSKLTRESGTIVVQVGEGSDEEFVGYTSMLRDYNFYNSFWKNYNSLPSSIKKIAYNAASPLFYMFKQYEALEFMRRSSYGQQLYWAGNSILSPVYMKKLLNGRGDSLIDIPSRYINSLYNQSDSINPDADFLQKCLFLDVTQRLPELLLMRVDKVSMAHSIECRVPFLDHRIVEFAMKIPSDKKVPDKNVTKHLLKQAVKGILPDNIINRKKQGFWAPVDEWLRHDWFSFTKSTILDNKLTGSDLFNKSFITGMLENHRSGKRNEGKRLFALLTLALWHNKYFGKI